MWRKSVTHSLYVAHCTVHTASISHTSELVSTWYQALLECYRVGWHLSHVRDTIESSLPVQIRCTTRVAALGTFSPAPEISPCSSITLSCPVCLHSASTYHNKFSIMMICSFTELYEYFVNKKRRKKFGIKK